VAFLQASITPLDQSLRESLNYFYEGFILSGMSWMVDGGSPTKKDAANKLEHFDFTFVKALNSFKNFANKCCTRLALAHKQNGVLNKKLNHSFMNNF
jgi:hypothetical protein